MASEQIGEYEIEYSGVQAAGTEGWSAYVTVYGPSPNPMHRNIIVPHQHVAVETIFPTEVAAADEARKIALTMIK